MRGSGFLLCLVFGLFRGMLMHMCVYTGLGYFFLTLFLVIAFQITEIKPLELKLKFGVGFRGRVHITEVFLNNLGICYNHLCDFFFFFCNLFLIQFLFVLWAGERH